MNQPIDLLFIPEHCDAECPVLRSSQIAALSVVAEAQALFQGFLKCLDRMEPGFRINPDSKKGASMLEHFTGKLDKTIVNLFEDPEHHCSKARCGTCPYHGQGDVEEAEVSVRPNVELVERELYDNVVSYSELLQDQCEELKEQVDHLLGELAKRRTQYDNRLLIHIFEQQYRYYRGEEHQGSFFDIVPRERLKDFIPFLRNIVLGPAISNDFDDKVEEVLEKYKDGHGHVPVGRWEDVLDDVRICKILDHVTGIFYERSQHKESFRALIHRKAPIAPQKFAELICLFESMGMGIEHEFEMAG